MQALQNEIVALIRQSEAQSVAMALHDLATGKELLINADLPFHPASTFKLCVMMELYRQVEQGSLALDAPLRIKNTFTSIADGSSFWLDAADDSEQSLYGKIGRQETLREINRLMIIQSSNLATNLLIELLTAASVTAYMHQLGASDLKILRGPEDNQAYARGMNNVATARGLQHVLKRLAEGRIVSASAAQEMIAVLLEQHYNEGIPSGVPIGTPIAHKTGWNDQLYHDAAIVFPAGRAPYVLVVLTHGLPEETVAPRLVAEISRYVAKSLAIY